MTLQHTHTLRLTPHHLHTLFPAHPHICFTSIPYSCTSPSPAYTYLYLHLPTQPNFLTPKYLTSTPYTYSFLLTVIPSVPYSTHIHLTLYTHYLPHTLIPNPHFHTLFHTHITHPFPPYTPSYFASHKHLPPTSSHTPKPSLHTTPTPPPHTLIPSITVSQYEPTAVLKLIIEEHLNLLSLGHFEGGRCPSKLRAPSLHAQRWGETWYKPPLCSGAAA